MAPFHTPVAKTHKLTVEDCIAFDTAMLRKKGMLLEFMDHRLQRQWKRGSCLVGDIFLTTTFTGDIAYPSLRIDGTCFDQAIVQTVRLVSKAMRFGGKRWYFVCPKTKRLCAKLILPPGAKTFASIRAWDVLYQSQYDDPATRAHKAIALLRKQAEAKPKYTRAYTREAIAARISAKEQFLDRVITLCEQQIANGHRISLRKAAQHS